MTIDIERASIRDIEEEVDKDIDLFQHYVVEELQDRTPKDTGHASRNWNVGTGDVLAYNHVDYVEYLEQGHSRQAPHGFVEDAIRAAYRRVD